METKIEKLKQEIKDKQRELARVIKEEQSSPNWEHIFVYNNRILDFGKDNIEDSFKKYLSQFKDGDRIYVKFEYAG